MRRITTLALASSRSPARCSRRRPPPRPRRRTTRVPPRRRSRCRRTSAARPPRRRWTPTSPARRARPGSRTPSGTRSPPTADRGILAALDAGGEMDASSRSSSASARRSTPVACEPTNRRGMATVDIDAARGADYLIRVAPLANSVTEGFSLRVVVPDQPAQPPGRALPARRRERGGRPLREPRRRVGRPPAGGPHLPDQHRHAGERLRPRVALRAGRVRLRLAAEDARLRPPPRVHAGRLGRLHAARRGAARLARPAALPAARRPRRGRRLGARPRRSPTTAPCAARSRAPSSTPSTSTGSRSRSGPTCACG